MTILLRSGDPSRRSPLGKGAVMTFSRNVELSRTLGVFIWRSDMSHQRSRSILVSRRMVTTTPAQAGGAGRPPPGSLRRLHSMRMVHRQRRHQPQERANTLSPWARSVRRGVHVVLIDLSELGVAAVPPPVRPRS